jgi:UDP-N-acetylmuramyl pentapeptide phosphotransferase/UDP-N-acetylglucosamine-1-phosphate transferase
MSNVVKEMLPDPANLLVQYLPYLTLVSFLVCVGLIALAKRYPRLFGRAGDLDAVQSMHTRITPRVGGVAVFSALILGVLFVPEFISENYFKFIAAGSILFITGMLEDLGVSIPPRMRLLSAVVSSLLAIILLQVWIPTIGVPFLDPLLGYWFVGIPITLLITAGVANGFNLIDGVNGLATMTAMTAAIAIAMISQQAGYTEMAQLCLTLSAAILGLFLLNFPFGLIFLGDAGAYTIGFALSWFGIVVLANAPEVSAWAILLALFWPLADTLLAIVRRGRSKQNAMAPDRLHVHQLVMRALEICFLGRGRRQIANPLTTVVLAPLVIAPQVFAVIFWNNNMAAFLTVVTFLVLFFASYISAPPVIRALRRRKPFSAN